MIIRPALFFGSPREICVTGLLVQVILTRGCKLCPTKAGLIILHNFQISLLGQYLGL